MKNSDEIEIFYPKSVEEWREWLIQNHETANSVWVVFHKKSSQKPSITWSESVEEALCFGWIDSKKVKVDTDTSHQFFSKRKNKSTWSKINKDKIQELIASGKMTEAGLKSVKISQENGSWNILDEVDALIIPNDLEMAFQNYEGAKDYFWSLSKSSKKMLLQWIVMAKQDSTRQKRIDIIAECASRQTKPPQFA